MKKLFGRPLAQTIISRIAKNTQRLTQKPELHIISCFNHPAVEKYLNAKISWAKEAQIKVKIHKVKLPSEKKILSLVENLNLNPNVTGIVIQLPLPKEISLNKVVWKINPIKDVDGFQMRLFRPPAPSAIIEILNHYHIPLAGKKVHLLGYGFLVNQPLSILLKKIGAKVTISTSQTSVTQTALDISSADIVISATGKKGVVEPEWINSKQVLVDAGTSCAQGKQIGDLSLDVLQRARAAVPAIGGIGPLTIAKLLENTYQSYLLQMIKK